MKNAYLKYLGALLLFGSNGVVSSYISLASYEIVFFRALFGGLFLALIFLLTKRRFTFFHHRKELLFLLLSGMAMGASWMFLYEAYEQIGVGMASLAYYCGPVIVMALSPLLFHEELKPLKVLGFFAVICGVTLINGTVLSKGGSFWGLFCGALSAVTYALMVITNKKAAAIKGLENTVLQLFFALVVVGAFVAVKGGFPLYVPSGQWPAVLMLSLLNTGVGCYLYFSALSRLPVQTVAVCGYLEPLSAVVFAALLLKEAMSIPQLCGAALIIGGALFAELMKSSPQKKRRPA